MCWRGKLAKTDKRYLITKHTVWERPDNLTFYHFMHLNLLHHLWTLCRQTGHMWRSYHEMPRIQQRNYISLCQEKNQQCKIFMEKLIKNKIHMQWKGMESGVSSLPVRYSYVKTYWNPEIESVLLFGWYRAPVTIGRVLNRWVTLGIGCRSINCNEIFSTPAHSYLFIQEESSRQDSLRRFGYKGRMTRDSKEKSSLRQATRGSIYLPSDSWVVVLLPVAAVLSISPSLTLGTPPASPLAQRLLSRETSRYLSQWLGWLTPTLARS